MQKILKEEYGIDNFKYPDRKYIATPLVTPDKDRVKWQRGHNEDGYRLNSMAGSNCMVMHKNVYKEVGEFTTHRIAGSHWHRKMHTMGYTIVAPQENKVEHLARNGGVDFYKDIRVTKELIDGSVIDFSLP